MEINNIVSYCEFLYSLMKKFSNSFDINQIEKQTNRDIDLLKTELKYFINEIYSKSDYSIKNTEIKQYSDIEKMNCSLSYKLLNGTKVKFLTKNNNNESLIISLLLLIHLFYEIYKYINQNKQGNDTKWNELTIIILLDDNKRILDTHATMYKKSLAMNPSGCTLFRKQTIFCTRIEEIHKLLFHELIHYVHDDIPSLITNDEKESIEKINISYLGQTIQVKWNIIPNSLIIREGCAEAKAILYNCAFNKLICDQLNINVRIEKLIEAEILYSKYLCGQILLFNGITDFHSFFSGNPNNKYLMSRIYIGEYVFMRTSLLLTNFNNLDFDFSDQITKVPLNNSVKYTFFEIDYSNLKYSNGFILIK